MTTLPEPFWTGAEPCRFGVEGTCSEKSVSYTRSADGKWTDMGGAWATPIGTNDPAGGISLADMNGYLANCTTHEVLDEMGYLPGTKVHSRIFKSGDVKWHAPIIGGKLTPWAYRDVSQESSIEGYRQTETALINASPIVTGYGCDNLMPKFFTKQFDSPLAFQIISDALPPPATKVGEVSEGNLTGEPIMCPCAGYFIVDCCVKTKTRVDIWAVLTESGGESLKSLPSIGSDMSHVVIPIFLNNVQVESMIPVDKGTYVNVMARVGYGDVPEDIHVGLRLLPVMDNFNWER